MQVDPITAYDLIASRYDQRYGDRRSLAENHALFSILRPWLARGRWLDLGCGTGLSLDYIHFSLDTYKPQFFG